MFGAHRNILFIIKVKVFEVMKWLYRSSAQLCSLLSVEWLTNCEHIVQSLLSTCILVAVLRSTPNHTPLKYRSLIKKKSQVRPLYRLIFPKGSYWLAYQICNEIVRQSLIAETHFLTWYSNHVKSTYFGICKSFRVLKMPMPVEKYHSIISSTLKWGLPNTKVLFEDWPRGCTVYYV